MPELDQVFESTSSASIETHFANITQQSILGIAILKGNDMAITFANQRLLQLWGKGGNVTGKNIVEAFPEIKDQSYFKSLHEVYLTGKPYYGYESKVFITRNGRLAEAYFNFVVQPYFEENNTTSGVTVFVTDVTEAVLAKKQIEENENQFRNVLLASPSIFAILKGYPDMVITFGNEPLFKSWGKTSDIVGKPLLEVLPELKNQPYPKLLKQVYDTGVPEYGREVKAVVLKNGKPVDVYYNFVYQPIFEKNGAVSGITIMANDVTDQVVARKAVEEQNLVLQMVTSGASLTETLTFLLQSIERQSNNEMIGSVLLLDEDGKHLRHGAAPGLPDEYNKAIDGIEIGPGVGCCGTAAYTRKTVAVSDIANDPLWNDFKDLALKHNLRACWSTPIISEGKVLATFALYYRTPHIPTDQDKIIDFAIRTTTLIIERKRVEGALQKSEAHLRALLLATSDVIYRMNPDWSEMHHLDGRNFLADTGKSINDWLSKYIHPVDQEHVTKVIREAVRTKNKFQLEHRVFQADGSLGWTLSRAIPILNHNGDILEWLGAASDVTERKRAEEALSIAREESDQRKRLYETITASTPDLIYVFDLNYKFTYANEALLKMWGRSWDESIGKGLLNLGYEPWHAEMHEREIDRVVATKKPIRGEVSFPHATLGRRIYDYIFVPVLNNDGEVEAVAGTTRDITDLKIAEEALKESEAKFRRFYGSNMLPIAFWDVRGVVYECNDAFAELVGYTQYEITTHCFNWRESTPPEQQHLNEEGIKRAVEQDVFVDPYEIDLIRKDGNRINVMVGYAMLEGSKEKGVAFLLDISEQKSLMTQLEKRVEERTNQLHRSNEDLQQFAHVASHDLKEPVRKIQTFGYRLQEELKDTAHEDSKLFIEKILKSTNRMRAMIEGILTYSTVTIQEQVQEIDLNTILDDIKNDLELVIQRKEAIIQYDPLPALEGVQVLIYQLFYNLINNALKFSKQHERPVITVRTHQRSMNGVDHIEIVIADNGIGFEPEYNERIFDTFIRLNSKDEYDGTGLGLSLCKKIVERHHGTITAKGELGRGATFTLTLPCKQGRVLS